MPSLMHGGAGDGEREGERERERERERAGKNILKKYQPVVCWAVGVGGYNLGDLPCGDPGPSPLMYDPTLECTHHIY